MSDANAFGFMARLSPRERTLLGMLLIVFFLMAFGVLYMLRASWFGAAREEIAALRAGIDLVHTRGTAYDTKKKEKEAREARIANITPVVFAILLEEAEKSLTAGSLRGQEEKPPVDLGNGLVKRTVSFELRTIGLEELMNFLTKIESQPGNILYVERLSIRSPSALEDVLIAEVELSTWELQKQDKPATPEGTTP